MNLKGTLMLRKGSMKKKTSQKIRRKKLKGVHLCIRHLRQKEDRGYSLRLSLKLKILQKASPKVPLTLRIQKTSHRSQKIDRQHAHAVRF